ncbi:unnamed protein product [Brassica napus]|uniref:Uncharacterized protein n=2 Tax=Brassica TaxID=3705 RepID=M4ET18_BRACM|nr:unnamed protein product [Brassica napus]
MVARLFSVTPVLARWRGCEDYPVAGEGLVIGTRRLTSDWWLLSLPLVSSPTSGCGLGGSLWFEF